MSEIFGYLTFYIFLITVQSVANIVSIQSINSAWVKRSSHWNKGHGGGDEGGGGTWWRSPTAPCIPRDILLNNTLGIWALNE